MRVGVTCRFQCGGRGDRGHGGRLDVRLAYGLFAADVRLGGHQRTAWRQSGELGAPDNGQNDTRVNAALVCLKDDNNYAARYCSIKIPCTSRPQPGKYHVICLFIRNCERTKKLK